MAKTIVKEELRHRLEQERQRLQKEIGDMTLLRSQSDDPTLDSESYSNHPADVGSESYDMEQNMGLVDNLRRQLEATETALARFDEGVYGICSNCGRPIDPERLEALPHATLCIDCKRQQETEH
jgi:DnaK suppressor protein